MEDIIVTDKGLLIRNDLVSVRPRLKSSALRNTVLVDERTKEIVSDSLRTRFNYYEGLEKGLPLYSNEKNEIIKTALNLGLIQLADELTALT